MQTFLKININLLFMIQIFCVTTFAQNRWVSFTPSATSAASYLAVKRAVSAPGSDLPTMEVNDKGETGFEINYLFPGGEVSEASIDDVLYQLLHIDQFAKLNDPGKPALPARQYTIAVPQGKNARIEVYDAVSMMYSGYTVQPALEPASDFVGAPEPVLYRDEEVYGSEQAYPAQPVSIVSEKIYRGQKLITVQICPIQALPLSDEIIVYSKIHFEVVFEDNGTEVVEQQVLSGLQASLLNNVAINAQSIPGVLEAVGHTEQRGKILIVTTDAYRAAADTLSLWKRMMGYTVEIISKSSWATSAEVQDSIHSRYKGSAEPIDFCAIIGDNPDVPSYFSTLGSYDHVTDLYFASMDGPGDFTPDIAIGRISVSNPTEALMVVNKIVNYERNPVTETDFYRHGVTAAYFQHQGSGYAQRRFAQTSWEIRQYLTGEFGYDIDREFVTGSSVNPTYWNNGYYSSGEPIPSYLQKPNYAWDATAGSISADINDGRFMVFHRDHGDVTLWGDPYYTSSDVSALTNGDELPVVFSINCLTGKFNVSGVSFAEAFMRNANGGAVGVVAATEISYSGQNDGFAEGLVDAIWPNPGLVPSFPHNSTPTITPHEPVYHMGYVLNQGKMRMSETWNSGSSPFGFEQYSYELFHWHGDPSMMMWTDVPAEIAANVPAALMIGQPTYTLTGITATKGVATILFENEVLGRCEIDSLGTCEITFDTPAMTTGIATVSITGHNYRPLLTTINVIPPGDALFPSAPAAGQLYDVGETISIAWATYGIIPTVTIEMSIDSFATTLFSTTEANIDSYDWTAPSISSNNVQVRISDVDGDPTGITHSFSIQELSSISGSIIDSLPGVIEYVGPQSGSVDTDSSGQFALTKLLPGIYTLRAVAGDYSSDTVTVTVPGDTSGITFTINYPNVIATPDTLFAELNSGDIDTMTVTLTNSGTSDLTYAMGGLSGSSIIINEVSSSPDYIEIWNRGGDLDLTGWSLHWEDNNSTTGSYNFVSGFVITEDRKLIFSESSGTSNDSTIFYGSNLGWVTSSQVAVWLVNPEGDAVDFMKTLNTLTATPTGAEWFGPGVDFSRANVSRNNNEDADSLSDWTSLSTGTQYRLNVGQTDEVVIASWLEILDTLDGVISAGTSVNVQVQFNAIGLVGGLYGDTLVIENNSLNSPILSIPISMRVHGVKKLSTTISDIDFGLVEMGGSAIATVTFINDGSEATIIDSITNLDPHFVVDVVLPLAVAEFDSVSVQVSFNPTVIGAVTDIMTIISDASDNPIIDITLSGAGVEAPAIVVTPQSVSTVLAPASQSTGFVTIINDGGASLNWSAELFGGLLSQGNTDTIPGVQERNYVATHDITSYSWGDAGNDAFDGFGFPSIAVGGISQNVLMTEGASTYTINGYEVQVNNDFAENHIWRMRVEAVSTAPRSDVSINLYGNMGSDGSEVNYFDTVTIGSTELQYYVNEANFPNNDPRVVFLMVPSKAEDLDSVRYWQPSPGNVSMEAMNLTLPATVYIIPSYYPLENIELWIQNDITAANGWFDFDTTDGSVNPGDSAVVGYTFDSGNLLAGIYTDSITINHNAPIAPVILSTQLEVLSENMLNTNQDSISFPDLYVGQTSHFDLELINSGNGVTTVDSILSSNGVFATDSSVLPLEVPAFGSATVSVTYVPVSVGSDVGTITMYSNALDNPEITISLSGSAILGPVMSVDPDSMVFNLAPSQSPQDLLGFITNSGDADLTYAIKSITSISAPVVSSKSQGFVANYTVHEQNNMFAHEHVAGELIVGFHPGASEFSEFSTLNVAGMSIAKDLSFSVVEAAHIETTQLRKVVLLRATGDAGDFDLIQARESLLRDPSVAFVDANFIYRASVVPNDTEMHRLFGMDNYGQTGGTVDADIDAVEAWDIHTGSGNVILGVIDTGIDYLHPDLIDNVWTNPGEIAGNGIDDDGNGYIDDIHGWDFHNNDNDPMDDNEHGTHCSGTIGGTGNNGVGVAGVNWNVQIAGLKFLSGSGSGSSANAILAVNYATAMGFKITSNSWGGGGFSQALKDAIELGGSQGHVFIAAAGNSNRNTDSSPAYPASYDSESIISVAATDHNDARSSFSNYGLVTVDLGAPGSAIYSTTPSNTYASFNGTSMATPHVAGAAALVLSYNEALTGPELKEILLTSVDSIASMTGITTTNGRLNVFNALNSAGSPWLSATIDSIPVAGAGEIDSITVTANPDGLVAGTYVSEIVIKGNDLNTPEETIVVTAHVAAHPALTADPDSLDFVNGLIGQNFEQEVELVNTGNGATTVDSIVSTNGLFSIDSGIFPLNVPAFSSVTITVTYSPIAVGTDVGIITVFSDALSSPELTIAVQGTTVVLSSISGGVVDSLPAVIEYEGSYSGSIDTDSSGQFILENLFPGTYTLRAIAGVHVSDTVTVTVPGDTSGIIFTINYPIFEIAPDSLFVDLNSGDIDTMTVTLTNSGTSDLAYNMGGLGGSSIIINEVSSSPDYIEIWNRGGDLDLTDWSLHWEDNTSTTGSYNFVSGFVITEGRKLIFSESSGISNDSTIYFGSNLGWVTSTQVAVWLVNPEGDAVDFVKTLNTVTATPAGTEWFGPGVNFSQSNISRNNNTDTDTLADWTTLTSGTQYRLNAGQTDEVVIASWLEILDTLNGVISAGSSLNVQVQFNATGLVGGLYSDTLAIENNSLNNPELALPVSMRVHGVKKLSTAISDIDFGFVEMGGTANATVTFINDGSEATIIDSIDILDPHFVVNTVLPLSVAEFDSASVQVSFNPTAIAAVSDIMTIISDASDNPIINITLSGAGLEAPAIVVTPRNVSAVLAPASQSTGSVTIINDGGASLDWSAELFGGLLSQGNTDTISGVQERNYVASHDINTNNWGDAGNDAFDGFGYPSITVGSTTENVVMTEGDSIYSIDGYDVQVTNDFAENHIWRMRVESVAGATRSDISINLFGNMGSDGSEVNYFDTLTVGTTQLQYYVNEADFPNNDPRVVFLMVPSQTEDLDSVRYWQPSSGNVSMEAKNLTLPATVYIIPSYYPLENIELWLQNDITTSNSWFDLDTTSGTISAGDSTVVGYTFESGSLLAGIYTDSIVINHNAPIAPVILSTQLEVLSENRLIANQDSISFPRVYVGQSSSFDVGLVNGGNGATTIDSIISSNGSFIVNAGIFPIAVAPLDSSTISVTYSPISVGTDVGVITIYSDAINNPIITVNLSGSALIGPLMSVDPDSMVFNLTPSQSPQDLLGFITNSGDAELTYTIKSIASVSAPVVTTESKGFAVNTTVTEQNSMFAHEHVAGELIVGFHPGASEFSEFSTLNVAGMSIVNDLSFALEAAEHIESTQLRKVVLLRATGEAGDLDLYQARESLLRDPSVAFVDANFIYRTSVVPNDTEMHRLFGMDNYGQTGGTVDADIDAVEAWDIHTGSGNVVLGVIDTGIDYLHPDLIDNVWTNPGEIAGNGIDDDGNGYIDDIHGWDFHNNDNDPMDDNEHGTHCSGTIGGTGNNGVGVAGVNWDVQIAGLKFLSGSGSGSSANAILAVNYATAMGFKITSNSWGGGGFSQALKDAIELGGSQGNIFIAAAGNSNRNTDSSPAYPASYDSESIISVAATDHNDARSSFSNYGLVTVDLGAPGSAIYSTTPGNTYASFNGTSMATPHVAGAAALVLSYNEALTGPELKEILLTSVDSIASMTGITTTNGRLNVFNALNSAGSPWLSATIDSIPVAGAGEIDSITVTANPDGLIAGTYVSEIIILGDDSNNPEDTIVVTAHVSACRELIASVDSLDFGSINTLQVATQTVTLTNACNGPVTVSSITGVINGFGVVEDSLVVPAFGSYDLVLTFADTVIGFQSETMTIVSDADVASVIDIVLKGEIILSPDLAVNINAINETAVPGESVSVPFALSNIGGGILEANLSIENLGFSEAGDSAEVLIWTVSADMDGEYLNVVNAINANMSQVNITNSAATDSLGLELALTGKSAFVIMEQEGGIPTGIGASLGPVMNEFVSNGGVIIVHAPGWNSGSSEFIAESGLMDISYQGIATSGTITILDSTHAIFDGVTPPMTMRSASAYFQVNDSASNVLATYSGNPVIAERIVGKGYVFLLAPDYFDVTTNWARVLTNTIQIGEATPRWISLDTTAASISAGDSTLITANLSAAELVPGIYTADIRINHNGVNGYDIIPVTFEVTDSVLPPEIQISINEIFDSLAVPDSSVGTMVIYNNGGDTLEWNFDSTGAMNVPWFDVSAEQGVLAPGDSIELLYTLYSENLTTAFYLEMLTVLSNDTVTPVVSIPVMLIVHSESIGPILQVSIDSLYTTTEIDSQVTEEFYLTNSGDEDLFYIIKTHSFSNGLENWLSLNTYTGWIAPGDSLLITALFDTVGQSAGVYEGIIDVETNSLITPVTSIATQIIITEPVHRYLLKEARVGIPAIPYTSGVSFKMTDVHMSHVVGRAQGSRYKISFE